MADSKDCVERGQQRQSEEQFKLENTGNYLSEEASTETIAWGVNP